MANPKRAERRNTLEQYKQLSHTTYLCNYHVIFCPKYRFRIMHGRVGQRARDLIRKVSGWKGAEIIKGARIGTDQIKKD